MSEGLSAARFSRVPLTVDILWTWVCALRWEGRPVTVVASQHVDAETSIRTRLAAWEVHERFYFFAWIRSVDQLPLHDGMAYLNHKRYKTVTWFCATVEQGFCDVIRNLRQQGPNSRTAGGPRPRKRWSGDNLGQNSPAPVPLDPLTISSYWLMPTLYVFVL